MNLPLLPLEHAAFSRVILWATLIMAALVILLVLLSAFVQARADRSNRRRIALFNAWEEALPAYLYLGQNQEEAFGRISSRELKFFQAFLLRYRNTLGGEDAKRLKALYRDLQLDKDLPIRLAHPKAVIRAQAAMEVETYECLEHLEFVAQLLGDPKPFVAFAAARALASVHGIEYAPQVVAWMLRQEDYQQDRLLEILEDFGPGLLRWSESSLGPAQENPMVWRFYALLAASMRDEEALPVLQGLLKIPEVELQAATLRALGALGDMSVWEEIRPFFRAQAPASRLHAARAAGFLGHLPAVDDLLELLSDPIYEVRREAGSALTSLGNLGWEALVWVAADEHADRFARDMAIERLDWGRP